MQIEDDAKMVMANGAKKMLMMERILSSVCCMGLSNNHQPVGEHRATKRQLTRFSSRCEPSNSSHTQPLASSSAVLTDRKYDLFTK